MRLVIGLLLLTVAPAAAQGPGQAPFSAAAAHARVESLATEYYRAKFAMYPAYATAKGVRTQDSALSQFAPLKVRKFIIGTKGMLRDLAAVPEDSLSLQAWVDLKALQADMEGQVFLLQDRSAQTRSPLLYVDACTNGLYQLVIRDAAFRSNPNFVARLSAVPGVLETARKNLTQPIRLHGELAAASITAFLPFLEGLADPADADHADLARAAGEARTALVQFEAYLDSIRATADTSFALGYDDFAKLLQTGHLIQDSPEELLAYAERTLKDARAKLSALPPEGESGARDLDGALRLTKADILASFNTEADSAIAFLERRHLVTVPHDTPVIAVETPGFIRVLVPGYAYEPPGPADSDQLGLLYVPLPEELDLESQVDYKARIDQRKYRGIVVHELYPGHHLQITSANRAGTLTRRMAEDLFTVEGWALYCEEMMAAEGYYGPEGTRRMLRGVVLRAARAVVDIKLQTGRFSLDEAVDFMASQTDGNRTYYEQEVRRYAVEPAQAMSYLIGKREIVSLRDEMRRIEGDRFTLGGFHDALVRCGSLAPYLVRISMIAGVTGRE